LIAVLWLWLAGCGHRTENVCVDRGDCGALEVCEQDTCRAVECVSTADCGAGGYCEDSKCKPGCDSNDRCLAGESCSADHECVTYDCRTSALDCGLGEVCDHGTGECAPALGCNPCTDDTQCGAGICSDWKPGPGVDRYCLVPCTVEGGGDQCGRGLECRDLSGVGDLYCYADCPAFQKELAGG
jgi:hypothetical protein